MDDGYFDEATYDNITFVRVTDVVLFYTAEYFIEVAVVSPRRTRVLFTSDAFSIRPSRNDVVEWLRDTIQSFPIEFQDFDIDAELLYDAAGGDVDDLWMK